VLYRWGWTRSTGRQLERHSRMRSLPASPWVVSCYCHNRLLMLTIAAVHRHTAVRHLTNDESCVSVISVRRQAVNVYSSARAQLSEGCPGWGWRQGEAFVRGRLPQGRCARVFTCWSFRDFPWGLLSEGLALGNLSQGFTREGAFVCVGITQRAFCYSYVCFS